MTGIEIVGVTAAVLAAGTVGAFAARAFARLRGTRVVSCPETRAVAAVEVDLAHAVSTAITGRPHFRLSDCSRWPERAGCGQECLAQVEGAPEDCLVRHLLSRWYADRECAFCRRTIGEVQWHEHRPGLLSPEGVLVEWADVPPETVPGVLVTHRAVCWNCLVAESFRRQHADLVVDRRPHAAHLTH